MDAVYLVVIPLLVGFLADFLFGDPFGKFHPVVLYGNLIAWGEKRLNRGKFIFMKGSLLSIGLIIGSFLVFYFLEKILLDLASGHWGDSSNALNHIPYLLFTSLMVFFALAHRSLVREGKAVIDELENKGLEAGRKRLSWIVGRETSQLNPQQIYRSVLETLSENLSDGVIAPLFWYAVLGVPGMLCYKMINTLDSMIGYKSDRYFYFGKTAAYIDDAANYFPARITALIMAVVGFSPRALAFIYTYRKAHASPNAAWPESALAGILNCRFGGPNIYYGKLVDKPWIGKNQRELKEKDIKKAIYINHYTSIAMLLFCAFVLWMVN